MDRQTEQMNVLYLREREGEQPRLCGSSALGSAVSWSSVPGLQWVVRGDGLQERRGWGITWLLLLLLALISCVLSLVTLTGKVQMITKLESYQMIADDDNILRRRESGLVPPLPPVLLCPDYSPGQERRARVESQLPVMGLMWDTWDNVTAGRQSGLTAGAELPWANDSLEVRQFLARVMYEGGRLAAPDCQDIVQNCHQLNHQKVLTEKGLCIEVSPEEIETRETLENSIKQEFINQKEMLRISVRLKSDSVRLGHPLVNMNYWGDSQLCDSQWSHREAEVMCRELGFSSGAKFYQAELPQDSPGVRYAPYLGRFQCAGQEERLTDCDRVELPGGCPATSQLSLLLCDVGGLDGVHKETKVHGYPFIEGAEGPEYFCEDDFSDGAAGVFCRMLGWSSGRVTVPGEEVHQPTRTVKCSGDEAHILDCQTGSDPGSVKGCRAVCVACDPGFPLTLRLHQAGAARLLGAGRAGRAGYPVIDTTDRMGLICSGATDSTAVNMICRNLGYKHGLKLPAGYFGPPSSSQPFFVFEAVRCLGNESSVFDCSLSPWGVEGCHHHDILAVMCANDKQILGTDYTITSAENEIGKLSDKISNFLSIPARKRNSATYLVPKFKFANYSLSFCLSDTFDVTEASALCRSLGYQCGAPDFDFLVPTQNTEETLFVSVQCEAGCQYEVVGDCRLTSRLACHAPCPPGLATPLLPSHTEIRLREDVSSCMEIFLDSVNLINKISAGSTVRVATTVVTEEGGAEEEEGVAPAGSCLRRLLVQVCGCLPWYDNSRLEQLTCLGEQHNNCSQSVRGLWTSVGGDCRAAVVVARQTLRLSLGPDICQDCPQVGRGTRLTHHVTQSSSGCGQARTVSLVRDLTATATYTRHRPPHWLHLLATFGGVWSLLTGLSVLSLVELLYWFSSHLYRPPQTSHTETPNEAPAFALVETGEVQDVLVITDLTEETNGEDKS